MATDIRHTKKQVNSYQQKITDITTKPLQQSIVDRLATARAGAEAWRHEINQSFNDQNYQDDVSLKSEKTATGYISVLSDWQKNKMQTQFKNLFGIDVIPILKDGETKAFLQPAITENINLIQSIPAELLPQVNEEFDEIIFKDGFDQQKVLTMLTQRFGVANSRAKLIANDQTGKVITALTNTRHNQAGVKQFIWKTAEDEAVRSSHAELDGKIFFWDQPPPIGLPGEPINCRCIALPFIPEIN